MTTPASTSLAANHGPEDRVGELITLYKDPRASAAEVLCDRHPVESVAYTVVQPDLTSVDLTYGQLREDSERFAAGLAGLGVQPGDRVATLMGKSTDYLVTVMGIWRLGAVHVPLFTAFAPPAIDMRLVGSDTKVVVCDAAQRTKLDTSSEPANRSHRQVIIADRTKTDPPLRTGDLELSRVLADNDPGWSTAALGGDAPLIQIYTSGTTGRPKAVVVPTWAIAGFRAYLEHALDVRPTDTYWCAADPGWAYGLYFGILGSFSLGVRSVLLHAGFSVQTTYAVLERCQVTNFAAAPTVYRAMRASATTPPTSLALRCASSAGEPLTPEINEWAIGALGVPVYDHYGQTEAGMLINNHHHPALARPLRQGSMGHPMPGWSLQVLRDDRDEVAPPNTLGRITVDLAASPLAWFSGYENDPGKSAEKFSPDRRWYLTGDAGRVDDDGYFHFSARDDDVIIMAGYRIGPFEVESVLLNHPNVVEAAVIAVPDDVRGEVLEAFVVLRDTTLATPELATDLQRLVKDMFAAHAYPRAIHFTDELPKTPSGKIQRFKLREQRRAELAVDAI
jgi:acetyl-CoA synthetase